MESNTMHANKVPLSLSDLNLAVKCEASHTFEYIDSAGKETGVLLTVLGSQAPKVQDWVRKSINQRRTRDEMNKKRGKEVQNTVEDDEDFSNEAAAIRLVGWEGITEQYSHSLALQLIANNRDIRDQIFAASNDLSNFTKG